MFLQISCYPCGAILLRMKPICLKCMLACSVGYTLGERYILYRNTHTEHNIYSSIASVKNSIFKFRSLCFLCDNAVPL